MTLGFKQEISGKPTYFPEKIIAGLDLYDHEKMTLCDHLGDVCECTDAEFLAGKNNPIFNHQPKLHTIREDKKNLWKAGNLIHPVINNRTADRFQFAPVMKCVSIQYFQVLYDDGRPTVYIGDTEEDWAPFYFTEPDEDITYGDELMKLLALNDGFESVADFFKYFSKDFTGKIIHWTDLRH